MNVQLWSCHPLQTCLLLLNSLPERLSGFADGLAYSALLKNELLGAGIEKVQDPQTEDRRLQPSTPEKKSLFTVSGLLCIKPMEVARVHHRTKHTVLLSCSARETLLWPKISY